MDSLLKPIGKACKRLRRDLKYTQQMVADETNYSVKTVSAFETGRLNNAFLLMWYIDHGLLDRRGDKHGKTTRTHCNGSKT